ncbi:MAG TPA: hypothetical protein VMD30_06885 [Tepidisphaeraceae bacterium]|nr:hypothetical protein [Tepidisphaeraceae bacterium]
MVHIPVYLLPYQHIDDEFRSNSFSQAAGLAETFWAQIGLARDAFDLLDRSFTYPADSSLDGFGGVHANDLRSRDRDDIAAFILKVAHDPRFRSTVRTPEFICANLASARSVEPCPVCG